MKSFERSGNRAPRSPDTDDPFRTIYEREAPGLIRFFRKRTGSQDDAEDLAQETLSKFHGALQRAEVHTPQAFLRTIATNLLRNRAVHSSQRLADLSTQLEEGEEEPAEDDQHRTLVGRQELEHFERVLQQLKPRTLEIFLLSRVEGYTYKEIADILGMTVFGVKWHMLRAIEHVDRNRRSR